MWLLICFLIARVLGGEGQLPLPFVLSTPPTSLGSGFGLFLQQSINHDCTPVVEVNDVTSVTG